ncbi:MAG: serine/threonine-protein phosphatase, partial [Bacteroidetes bacterium]|nr:serine/threonine-protein phosphatase [Bacteroidota bacterium]
GAFMSFISMGILNEILFSKSHIKHTDDILNELRRIIILSVNPEGASEEGKDGMDAVLCRFDFKRMELEYSAANNSFYIIRNGELLVFKPDKMPVGKYVGLEKTFTRTIIPLQKGDCIYTFSDGYADQFGGPNGKKIMSKQLKELLLLNSHLSMKEQKKILAQTFDEWKGNIEQVDDVLIIGIRV